MPPKGGSGAIQKLAKVKARVKEFAREVERIEQYAQPDAGVVRLHALIDEVQSMQAAIGGSDPTTEKPNGGSYEERAAAFTEWFERHGGVLNGCRVMGGVAEGSALVASADATAGTELVRVPASLVLSVGGVVRGREPAKALGKASGAQKKAAKAAAAAERKLGEWLARDDKLRGSPIVVLALALLAERAAGDKSFWAPYVNMLPTEFSVPLFWRADDVLRLRGSPAFDEHIRFLSLTCRQYSYVYEQLAASVGAPLSLNHCSLRAYLWAVGAVITRRNKVPLHGAGLPADECLIPMWDMCNHRVGRITTNFDSESRCVTCEAQSAVAAGEQVTIHYGDRSVAHMLAFAGFVPPRAAAHDFLPLWLRLPPPPPETPALLEARREHVARKRLLEAAGVAPGPYRLARDALDADAHQAVRALVLAGDALAHATPDTLRAPLALAALEARALELLRGAVAEMLAAYAAPGDAAADAAADSDAAAAALAPAALARKLVARERSILRDTDALIAARIDAERRRAESEPASA